MYKTFRERLIALVWLMALCGLAACQTSAPETATLPEPTAAQATATATPKPRATSAASTPTPEKAADPTQATGSQPSPTPTRPWQIPLVEGGEWEKGTADAGLVLVEYSDFQ